MKAIAKEAGVGIGTLYRRFPTREALVEAVYRNEVTSLCAAASELLASQSALDALRAWMAKFVDLMATKHGMGEALRAVLVSEDERMRTRYLLRDALAVLLDAGVSQGVVRAGLDPYDVLMALGGLTLIAEGTEGADQRRTALRLVELLISGIGR